MKTTTEKFYKSKKQVQIIPKVLTSSVASLWDCRCQCLLRVCLSLDCFYWVAAQA